MVGKEIVFSAAERPGSPYRWITLVRSGPNPPPPRMPIPLTVWQAHAVWAAVGEGHFSGKQPLPGYWIARAGRSWGAGEKEQRRDCSNINQLIHLIGS